MAVDLGELYVTIGARADQLDKAINGVTKQLQQLNTTATSQLERLDAAVNKPAQGFTKLQANIVSFGSALQILERGVAIVERVGGELIRLADTSTLLEAKIRNVTASQQEAVTVQNQLFDVAQNTRTGVEATTELYTRFARASQGLNVSQAELISITDTLNKSLKVAGTGTAEAHGAIVQLAQGFQSGALRGQELNSVIEQFGPVANAIAKEMGVPIEQLRKLAEEGKITRQVLLAAFTSLGKEIEPQFKRIPVTVSDAVLRVQNDLLKAVGEFDKATGASRALAQAIDDIRQAAVDSLPQAIEHAKAFGSAVGDAFSFVIDNRSAIVGAIEGVAGALALVVAPSLLAGIRNLAIGLAGLAASNPILATLTALGVAAGVVKGHLDDLWRSTREGEEAGRSLQERTQHLNATLKTAAEMGISLTDAQRQAVLEGKFLIDVLNDQDAAATAAADAARKHTGSLTDNSKEAEKAAKALQKVRDEYSNSMRAIAQAEQALGSSTDTLKDMLSAAEKNLAGLSKQTGVSSAELRKARQDVQDLTQAFADSKAIDELREKLKDLGDEGLKSVAEAVDDIQVRLAQFSMTPAQRELANFNRDIDVSIAKLRAMAATLPEGAASVEPMIRKLEELRTKGVAGLGELESAARRAADNIEFDIGDRVGDAFGQVFSGILQGTRDAEDVLDAFKDTAIGIFGDLFTEIIKKKVFGLDDKLKINFENDIPGMAQTGAGGIMDAFTGAFDSILDGAGGLASSIGDILGGIFSGDGFDLSGLFSGAGIDLSSLAGSAAGLGGGAAGGAIGSELGGPIGGAIGSVAGSVIAQQLASSLGAMLAGGAAGGGVGVGAGGGYAALFAAQQAAAAGAGAGAGAAGGAAASVAGGLSSTGIGALVAGGILAAIQTNSQIVAAINGQDPGKSFVNSAADPLGILGMAGLDVAGMFGIGKLSGGQQSRRFLGNEVLGGMPSIAGLGETLNFDPYKTGVTSIEEAMKRFPELFAQAGGAATAFGATLAAAVESGQGDAKEINFLVSTLIDNFAAAGLTGPQALTQIATAAQNLGFSLDQVAQIGMANLQAQFAAGEINLQQYVAGLQSIENLAGTVAANTGKVFDAFLSGGTVEAIRTSFSELESLGIDTFGQLQEFMEEAFGKKGPELLEQFSALGIESMKELGSLSDTELQGIQGAIVKTFGPEGQKVFDTFKAAGIDTMSAIEAASRNKFQEIGAFLGGTFYEQAKGVFEALKASGIGSFEGLQSASADQLRKLSGAIDSLGPNAQSVFNALKSAGINNFEGLVEGSKKQLNRLIEALEDIPNITRTITLVEQKKSSPAVHADLLERYLNVAKNLEAIPDITRTLTMREKADGPIFKTSAYASADPLGRHLDTPTARATVQNRKLEEEARRARAVREVQTELMATQVSELRRVADKLDSSGYATGTTAMVDRTLRRTKATTLVRGGL